MIMIKIKTKTKTKTLIYIYIYSIIYLKLYIIFDLLNVNFPFSSFVIKDNNDFGFIFLVFSSFFSSLNINKYINILIYKNIKLLLFNYIYIEIIVIYHQILPQFLSFLEYI